MRNFLQGFILGTVLVVVGCAASFPFRYYSTSMPSSCYDQGTLLGKTGSSGWQDLPLDNCKPDPKPSGIALKCLTMLAPDYYSMKADYLKCQNDLIKCQGGNPPSEEIK